MNAQAKPPVGSQAGFLTVDAMGALLAFMLLMPTLYGLWQMGMNEVKKRVIADHLSRVVTASQGYMAKHYDTLFVAATPTTGASVSIDILRDEKFLPQGFSDTNAWGQGYTLFIRKPSADTLQGIVLTSGGRGHSTNDTHFGNVLVPATAAMAGGFAGFIPTGHIAGQNSTELRGSFSGWVLPLTGHGLPNVGAGHLGALVNLDQASLGKDFLYRVKVPGQPELNAMSTELDMTDHAINKVKSLQFENHTLASMTNFCTSALDEGRAFLDKDTGLYLCRNGQIENVSDSGNSLRMQEVRVVSNGTMIPKPSCTVGTNTHPEIFAAPSIAAAGEQAPPMVSVQAWATDASTTEWQVHLRVLTTDKALDWIYPRAEYGRIVVMTTCAKD